MQRCATFQIAHCEQLWMRRQYLLLNLEILGVDGSQKRDEQLVAFFFV